MVTVTVITEKVKAEKCSQSGRMAGWPRHRHRVDSRAPGLCRWWVNVEQQARTRTDK